MKLYIIGALAALAFATPAFVTTASAAPVLYCSSGGINLATDGCISGRSNAYPGGGDGIYSNAGGGDDEAAVEAAILGATGIAADISLFGKSDDNPGLFTPTGISGLSGSWKTISGALIKYITVKAANSFALFDVGSVDEGFWSTAGILNNGGQRPEVSHLSFWTVDEPPAPVPLPAAGWLMVVGLGALAALRRRKTA